MKRILLIDDESGFSRLVKLTLESRGGYEVFEENNGLHALATARRLKPDLIFLDVVMPNIDGGDVASSMRRDPILRKTPIIFLTAIVSQKEEGVSGEFGGFPFLSKPVSIETMIECIQKHTPADVAEI